MENKLKPQSSDVLKIMNECNIRTIMATGDNVLTAISVARQCKMLSPSKTIFLGDLATDVDSLPHVEWTVIGEIESNGLQHPSIEG
jgi:cation-transporting P-type ATPase 13A2